jgi:putative transposase
VGAGSRPYGTGRIGLETNQGAHGPPELEGNSPEGTSESSPGRSPGYMGLNRIVPIGTAEIMSHSHVWCLVHVVFATAERRAAIPEEMQERLHSYLGGIARENKISSLAVGGSVDHVHLLLSLPRTVSVAKAIQLLKSGSSKWIHNFPKSRNFAWQEGYGAFSIGVSQRGTRVRYIQTQAEHHRRRAQKVPCRTRNRGMNSAVPIGTESPS